MYLEYKFVFSPLGIGFDCGRNFEIAMLGAIPIIAYWPGVLGYSRTGNLSVITVKSPDEVNETSWNGWKRDYTGPNELYKFSKTYWDERLFSNKTISDSRRLTSKVIDSKRKTLISQMAGDVLDIGLRDGITTTTNAYYIVTLFVVFIMLTIVSVRVKRKVLFEMQKD